MIKRIVVLVTHSRRENTEVFLSSLREEVDKSNIPVVVIIGIDRDCIKDNVESIIDQYGYYHFCFNKKHQGYPYAEVKKNVVDYYFNNDSREGDMIVFLDDDNKLYQNYFQLVEQNCFDCKKTYKFQQLRNDNAYVNNDLFRMCAIDTAQMLISREHIKSEYLIIGIPYDDGMMAEMIYSNNQDRCEYIDKINAYYNYFRQS